MKKLFCLGLMVLAVMAFLPNQASAHFSEHRHHDEYCRPYDEHDYGRERGRHRQDYDYGCHRYRGYCW